MGQADGMATITWILKYSKVVTCAEYKSCQTPKNHLCGQILLGPELHNKSLQEKKIPDLPSIVLFINVYKGIYWYEGFVLGSLWAS